MRNLENSKSLSQSTKNVHKGKSVSRAG